MLRLTALLCLTLFGFANASVTFFKDEAAFNAATAGVTFTTDTFSNNISAADTIFLDSGVVSANSGGNRAAHFVASGLYFNSLDGDGTGASLENMWTFPEPVIAIGFDYFSLVEERITVSVDGVTRAIRLVGEDADGFLGIVSLSPITSIVFDNVTQGFVDAYEVDNLRFGATEIPLPAPMLLFATVIDAAVARRRPRTSP
ncbi:MAG: PEP-CTERM sorting domain-containing protein [Pseudomonadota bacterium]